MKTKICTICKIEKPLSEFTFDNKSKDKLSYTCKQCNKDYIIKHRSEILLKRKEFRIKNKEKLSIEWKKYHILNKESLNKKRKVFYQLHRKEIIKERSIYFRKQFKTNISFKIKHNLRTRIQQALRGKNKSSSTIKLLGCSIDFLKKHLESQFTEGMTWQNYGRGFGDKGMKEWNIDHIKPCSMFDLNNPEEQQKCFHWNNLQPLWATINRQKRSNYEK